MHGASVTQCHVDLLVTYQFRTEQFSLCFLVSHIYHTVFLLAILLDFLTVTLYSVSFWQDNYQIYWWPLGFHVMAEIAESQRPGCPSEFMDIPIPKDDPIFGRNSTEQVQLQVQRVQWDHSSGQSPNNPRKQVTLHVELSELYPKRLSRKDMCSMSINI